MRAETAEIMVPTDGVIIECSLEEAVVIQEALYCLANNMRTNIYGENSRVIPRMIAEKLVDLELVEFQDAMSSLQ